MNIQTHKKGFLGALVVSLSISIAGAPGLAYAKKPQTEVISLIQMSDAHGGLVPHAGIIHEDDGSETVALEAGGLAKLKTVIDGIRNDPAIADSLLVAVGDTTHGSAEAMFTVGDAMMPALNAMGIDVFIPGNWDFGYGPAVYRARFAGGNPCQVPPNIRVMSDSDGAPCITQATFPTVAINLYNDVETLPLLPPQAHHKPLHPGFKLFSVGESTVAVIGITASIVPQQADVFNIGLRFTQGIEELPGAIAAAESQGADIIIVASELGLSQNIQIGRDFEEVDVVFSGHTHELTHGAILAGKDGVVSVGSGASLSGQEQSMLAQGAAIVVESGEDFYIGRLDVVVSDSKISSFLWEAIAADDNVAEDATVKALADAQEAHFVSGPAFHPHILMPGGFCTPPAGPKPCNSPAVRATNGLHLNESLDTVVGYTNVLLRRHDQLEEIWNNVIADAIRDVTNSVTPVDISMTNGFRFGVDILSPDEGATGEILLRDLYTHFPIGPAVTVAEFSGTAIEESLEVILNAVYNRNPYLQRGGWYVGLANMTQTIDLDNRPFGTSGGRIVKTKIGGVPLDPSKRYVFASCYPHGNPLDRVCRTPGGTNHQFFALADINDPFSAISVVPPLNTTNIIQGPQIKQVAPNAFLHPVHILRRFLDSNGPINEVDFATGRVQTVDSTQFPAVPVAPPVSVIDPELIQAPEGAGPVLMPK